MERLQKESPMALWSSENPVDKAWGLLKMLHQSGPAVEYQVASIRAQQQAQNPERIAEARRARYQQLLKEGNIEPGSFESKNIWLQLNGLKPMTEPKTTTPKPWSPIYSPDKMLIGMNDPATGKAITDPAQMPADVKTVYGSLLKAQTERIKNQKAEEAHKEALADRRVQEQSDRQLKTIQYALSMNDYKAAKKVVDTSTSDYNQSLDRLQTMESNLKSGMRGDQQAMLSLVANHIGMTLGAQKGARITRAVWDEATESAPLLQRASARFDDRGYLLGVTLTPDQMRQMVELGVEKVQVLKNHLQRVNNEYESDLAFKKKIGEPPGGKKTSAPQLVKMRAPNGEEKEVPEDQVEHYKSLGATVVK